MLAPSRTWDVVSVLAVLAGLCANPVLLTVSRHLVQSPTYNDSLPLVMLDPDSIQFGMDGISAATAIYLQEHTRSFAAMFPVKPWHLPNALQAERIPAGMLETIGSTPWRGRTLLPTDTRAIVVSYDLANGDPAWLNRQIRLEKEAFTVVGIMPPGFRLIAQDAQIWAILPPNSGRVQLAAKLKPGVSLASAQSDIRAHAAELKQFRLRHIELQTLKENRYRNVLFAIDMLKWNLAFVLAVSLLGLARFLLQPRRPVTVVQHLRFLAFLFARTLVVLAGFGIVWIVFMDRSIQHLFMDGSNWVLPFFSWGFLLATWGATVWCLRNQQYRCRVCCQELRMPVNSGRWSSLVIDRPRTEYICPFGHGTLYVPGTRLLDIDAVNWTSHDDIWRELFSEPVR